MRVPVLVMPAPSLVMPVLVLGFSPFLWNVVAGGSSRGLDICGRTAVFQKTVPWFASPFA